MKLSNYIKQKEELKLKKEDLNLKTYEIFRDYIKHEDSLINNRLTWLLVSQGLIFSAYSALFKPISDLTNNHKTVHELEYVQLILAVLALLICIISFGGIFAANLAIDKIQKEIDKRDHFKDLPKLTSGGSLVSSYLRLITPLAIPSVLFIAWLCLIIKFPFCETRFWLIAVVFFILGITVTVLKIYGLIPDKSDNQTEKIKDE